MKTRSHGFTLMELMIVLSIAGVILALGAPSFTEFRRNNRLVGVANDLLATTQTARTEAIKRQVPVAVCPSTNPEANTASCSNAFTLSGWIAFVDTNNNCLRDTGEAVVRVGALIDSAVTSKTDGNCLSFASSGFRQAIAPRNTITHAVFCDDRGYGLQAGTALSSARGVDFSATGRARITRNTDELTTGPSGSGWGITCP